MKSGSSKLIVGVIKFQTEIVCFDVFEAKMSATWINQIVILFL